MREYAIIVWVHVDLHSNSTLVIDTVLHQDRQLTNINPISCSYKTRAQTTGVVFDPLTFTVLLLVGTVLLVVSVRY